MKYALLLICVGSLFFIACPGEIPPGDSPPVAIDSVPTKKVVEDVAKKGQEEVLTQLLFTHGLETVVMALEGGVGVQYYQPPVESDMDVLLTWQTIALCVLDVYGVRGNCVITQLIDGTPEVNVTIPLSAVAEFRDKTITFEEYRKVFTVQFPANPESSTMVSGEGGN